MDLETAQTNTTVKLPLLKHGEYEMWKLRIEQYFQVQDYALWDVIENGNSFKPVARTTTNTDGTSTSLIPGPVTADEKTQKKNDVKARSMLLMALPNEHLLTFKQYKDAKTLFAAIQIRFGGNDATKKTRETLLKNKCMKTLMIQAQSLLTLFLTGFRRLTKPDLDTMSFDDLYNNFKIVEQEVKGAANSSSSSSSQNMAFMSSPSSTNEVNTAYEVNTANIQVSPASTEVSTANTQVSTANLSDATVYAFLANQPNGSQLVHEDLEQIHKDDLEEMDLKWQLALLSMRTRKFFQKTGRKITINGSDTVGYDKSKVECFNCHKLGHFAREYTSSKAMLAIDGAGFDWSYMADDKSLQTWLLWLFQTLRIEFNKSEFNLATYKRGLASVEEQLVFYKKNEVLFCEQLAVLKRDISYKDSEISELKSKLEKLKQEKESNHFKIENFDNASKSLDKLIGSQIPDKSRKGLWFASYNAVPPPHTGLFAPPTLDLSNFGLEEFQQPEFEGYGPKISKSVSENISNEVRKTPNAPLVEELVLDVDKSQGPKGNQRNWNNQKSQQLGSDFVMYNKACFVCGSFDHLQTNCNYHQREKVVSGSNYTRVNYNYSAQKAHPSAQTNMVPRAVLMKNGLRPFNTARPVNTAHPKTTVYSARPMPKAVNTARPNTAVVNAVRANQVNAVKASGHPQ
ncbi:ribonuclease H-like domain-containing protein, partial [Tanacetum coccineum]